MAADDFVNKVMERSRGRNPLTPFAPTNSLPAGVVEKPFLTEEYRNIVRASRANAAKQKREALRKEWDQWRTLPDKGGVSQVWGVGPGALIGGLAGLGARTVGRTIESKAGAWLAAEPTKAAARSYGRRMALQGRVAASKETVPSFFGPVRMKAAGHVVVTAAESLAAQTFVNPMTKGFDNLAIKTGRFVFGGSTKLNRPTLSVGQEVAGSIAAAGVGAGFGAAVGKGARLYEESAAVASRTKHDQAIREQSMLSAATAKDADRRVLEYYLFDKDAGVFTGHMRAMGQYKAAKTDQDRANAKADALHYRDRMQAVWDSPVLDDMLEAGLRYYQGEELGRAQAAGRSYDENAVADEFYKKPVELQMFAIKNALGL